MPSSHSLARAHQERGDWLGARVAYAESLQASLLLGVEQPATLELIYRQGTTAYPVKGAGPVEARKHAEEWRRQAATETPEEATQRRHALRARRGRRVGGSPAPSRITRPGHGEGHSKRTRASVAFLLRVASG